MINSNNSITLSDYIEENPASLEYNHKVDLSVCRYNSKEKILNIDKFPDNERGAVIIGSKVTQVFIEAKCVQVVFQSKMKNMRINICLLESVEIVSISGLDPSNTILINGKSQYLTVNHKGQVVLESDVCWYNGYNMENIEFKQGVEYLSNMAIDVFNLKSSDWRIHHIHYPESINSKFFENLRNAITCEYHQTCVKSEVYYSYRFIEEHYRWGKEYNRSNTYQWWINLLSERKKELYESQSEQHLSEEQIVKWHREELALQANRIVALERTTGDL